MKKKEQSKEQSQDNPIKLREESQHSCSVDDGYVFNRGLDDSRLPKFHLIV